jgi:hypothetical protein
MNVASAKGPKYKPPSPLVYEANKDGGYNFYEGSRRILYSKLGDEPGTQILYVPAQKGQKGMDKDTAILKVAGEKHELLDGYRQLRSQLPRVLVLRLEKQSDAVMTVLRVQPDRKTAGHRFPVPSAPVLPMPAPVARVDIPFNAPKVTIEYGRNGFGGWSFYHEGHLLAYTKPEPNFAGGLEQRWRHHMYMPADLSDLRREEEIASITNGVLSLHDSPTSDSRGNRLLKLLIANGAKDVLSGQPPRSETGEEHLQKLLGK